MSKINRDKINWIGLKFNSLTIIDKIGEVKINSGKNQTAVCDILLCECTCRYRFEIQAKSLLKRKSDKCPYCDRQNDIGKKIGTFTAISWYTRISGKTPDIMYNLQCDCGNFYECRNDFFKDGKLPNCLNCSKYNSHKYTYRKTNPNSYYSKLKSNSKKRNIEFLISFNELFEQLKSQNYRCSLSGLTISLDDGSASVDRINCKIGYITGNIQWVHRTINYMKDELYQEDFINLCYKIANFNASKIKHSQET